MGGCSSNAVDVCPKVKLSGRALASLIHVSVLLSPSQKKLGIYLRLGQNASFKSEARKPILCIVLLSFCWSNSNERDILSS
jgi:hypothetical protein